MELKVWVEGIQRIVCGVTEATTCQVLFLFGFVTFFLFCIILGCSFCLGSCNWEVGQIYPHRTMEK